MANQSPFQPKATKAKPRGRPCCPNHGEPLDGIGFPMPSKGTGICPVSKCPFDYEIQVDNTEAGQVVERSSDGTLKKVPGSTWKVSGDES